jgi:hypothetical protein
MTQCELSDLLWSHEQLRAALRIAESPKQYDDLQRRASVLIRRGRWRTEEESKLLLLFNPRDPELRHRADTQRTTKADGNTKKSVPKNMPLSAKAMRRRMRTPGQSRN